MGIHTIPTITMFTSTRTTMIMVSLCLLFGNALGNMTIWVKPLSDGYTGTTGMFTSGKGLELSLNGDETILNVKAQIETTLNVKAERQRLSIGTVYPVPLVDERNLSDYPLQHNDVISLEVRK